MVAKPGEKVGFDKSRCQKAIALVAKTFSDVEAVVSDGARKIVRYENKRAARRRVRDDHFLEHERKQRVWRSSKLKAHPRLCVLHEQLMHKIAVITGVCANIKMAAQR